MQISDRVASWLRTVVPGLWAALVTLLLEAWTGAPAEVADWLGSEATVGVVTVAVLAAWYALWRWAEPYLPAWARRFVLGGSREPAYLHRGGVVTPKRTQ